MKTTSPVTTNYDFLMELTFVYGAGCLSRQIDGESCNTSANSYNLYSPARGYSELSKPPSKQRSRKPGPRMRIHLFMKLRHVSEQQRQLALVTRDNGDLKCRFQQRKQNALGASCHACCARSHCRVTITGYCSTPTTLSVV